jgi:hypothetical protein
MSEDEQLAFWIVGCILAALYMLPTIIAFARGHANRWFIMVVNMVFGGTGLGWIGCLVWAFHAIHRTAKAGGTHGGESGLNLTANDPLLIEIADKSAEPTSLDSRIDQFQKLKQLRDGDVINQDEFNMLRREVLSR